MHKISVLIPVYNGERTIKKCIDSVLNQSFSDVEIIVVNDESTDGTLDILNGYKNIRVYNKKKTTVGDTRNYLISKCKTDYYFFLDADDYLEEDCLSLLYNEMIDNNCDLVMGLTDEKFFNKFILLEDKYEYLFNNEIPYFVTCWNKLYKSKIFKNIKFPSCNLAEDEFVIHHILKKSKKMCVLPVKTYNYINSDNGLSKKTINNYVDALNAFNDRLSFFKNTKYEKIMYRRFVNYIIEIYYLLKFNRLDTIKLIEYYGNIYNYKLSDIKCNIFKVCPNILYLLYKWRKLK